MQNNSAPMVRSPVFTWRTVPLDLMALGGLAGFLFLFVPDLQSFTKNLETVTADSMTFSGLSMLGFLFFRVTIALFSIVRGPNANKILGASCVFAMVVTVTPHLFRVPLLIGWAHRCGYQVDHVIHVYRDTKFVFRELGSPADDAQPDGKQPDM